MEKFEENIEKNTLEELYNTYIEVVALIDKLEKSVKELPAKEEL